MDAKRWARMRRVFEGALELPVLERESYVSDRCDGDADLRAHVLALLEADAVSHGLLDGGRAAFELVGSLAPPLPSRIGAYDLVEEVGRGGMGIVYRAERADGSFKRSVALKVVRGAFDSEEVLRRFHTERRILANLEHPNVARLYDAGVTEQGSPYLVMELVHGERIDRYCDTHGLDVCERIRLVRSACDAVRHAHRSLIIHRDLKPSNILVAAGGTVKLLDFGIAKSAGTEDPDQPGTRSGLRLLTPEYASPEQIRGEPLTTASDVYSLGVVLYELLTGRRPFRDWATAVTRALTPHERAEPPAPSRAATSRSADDSAGEPTAREVSALRRTTPERLRRTLDGDLDRIILTAIAADVGDRYASVEAFAADLDRWLEGRPISARQPSVAYRARMFVRRNRIAVASAAIVVTVVAGAAVVAMQQARVARAERDVALGISGFVEELFSASDPRVLRFSDTTRMRDFLDAAADRVRTELADQPRAQVRMLLVLGTTWRNIGRSDVALPLLREAHDAARALYGSQHEDVAESARLLGLTLSERDENTEAIPLLENALETQRTLTGEQSWEVARLHESLGQVLLRSGEAARAAPHVEASLAIRRNVLEPDDPVIASSVNTLAGVKSMLGRDREAIQLFEEAVELNARNPRTVPEDLAVSRMNLAALMIRTGMYGDAVTQARAGQALLESRYEQPFWVVALGRARLAEALAHRWREVGDSALAAEADSLFRSGIAMLRLLPESSRVRRPLHAYARFLHERGDLAAAELAMREVLARQEAASGTAHVDAYTVRASLSAILLDAGRVSEAERMAREAFEAVAAMLPVGHPAVANVTTNFARALAAVGRADTALALLAPVKDSTAAVLGDDHPMTLSLRRALDDIAESDATLAAARPDSL